MFVNDPFTDAHIGTTKYISKNEGVLQMRNMCIHMDVYRTYIVVNRQYNRRTVTVPTTVSTATNNRREKGR
jgi:hypothetical protein